MTNPLIVGRPGHPLRGDGLHPPRPGPGARADRRGRRGAGDAAAFGISRRRRPVRPRRARGHPAGRGARRCSTRRWPSPSPGAWPPPACTPRSSWPPSPPPRTSRGRGALRPGDHRVPVDRPADHGVLHASR
ncbi:hypothetical protein QJS66_17855 [Kocuria rhizophila]|nr:hypothetical protein QJS66_17855 [Kocuria rhizophila]